MRRLAFRTALAMVVALSLFGFLLRASKAAPLFGEAVTITIRGGFASEGLPGADEHGYECPFWIDVKNATKYHLVKARVNLPSRSIEVPEVSANSSRSGFDLWVFKVPQDAPSCAKAAKSIEQELPKAHVTRCEMEGVVEGDCQDFFVVKSGIDYTAVDAYDKAAREQINQKIAEKKEEEAKKAEAEKKAKEREGEEEARKEAVENEQKISSQSDEFTLKFMFEKIGGYMRDGKVGRTIVLTFDDRSGTTMTFVRMGSTPEKGVSCNGTDNICYQMELKRPGFDQVFNGIWSAGEDEADLFKFVRFYIVQGCDHGDSDNGAWTYYDQCDKCPPGSPSPHNTKCQTPSATSHIGWVTGLN